MAVRREAVLLELEDRFTAGMAKAAATTKVLKDELDRLDGKNVKASKSLGDLGDNADDADASLGGLRKTSRESSKEIDKLSGRVRILSELAVTLGPVLAPIGAVSIPAIIGLAGAFGAAAAGAGVALAAFNGMGDALKALDTYQLTPTTENLKKMQIEMDKLGPAGADFVRFLDGLEPQLRSLQMLAREGLLPGVEDGLTSMLRLMPQARLIVFNLATEMGNLSREAGDALGGEKFAAFFDYLQTDAAPVMADFAHAIGNVVAGFADIVVAFGPLTRQFTGGMDEMAASFARWAAGLAESDGFQGFVEYVQQNGPAVVELLGAVGTAFVGIVRAAAPIGAAVLPVLTDLVKIIGTIADSPLGAPFLAGVAGVLAFNRAAKMLNATLKATEASAALTGGSLATSLRFGGTIVALAAITSQVKKLERSLDEAHLAENLQAFADGGKAAGGLDLIDNSLRRLDSTTMKIVAKGTGWVPFNTPEYEKAQQTFEKIDTALAQMVQSGNLQGAKDAVARITEEAKAQGVSLEKVRDLLPSYAQALKDSDAAAGGAAANANAYEQALGRIAETNGYTASEIQGMTEAMQQQNDVALAAFDAVTQYGQALATAKEAASKGRRGLDENTKAGVENRQALSGLVAAWNNQGDAVRNNAAKYEEARANLIRLGTKMGATKAELRELAKAMDLPDKIVTEIKLTGSDVALDRIRRLKRDLATVPRSIRTDYYVNQINAINKTAANPGMLGRADGGTIPGQRAPYGDKVLTYLAPGEEVISNRYGQADRNRALLKQINANRMADGGTVRLSQGIGTATTMSLAGLNPKALLEYNKALELATKATLKRTETELNAAKQLRSSIIDGLRPDIFAKSDAFGTGPSPLAALRSSNTDLRAYITNVKALRKRGLDGGALKALLEQNDPRLVAQFRGMSNAELRKYEALYGKNQRLLNLAGSTAVKAVGGSSVLELSREVQGLRADVRRLDRNNQKATKEAAEKAADAVGGAGRNASRRRVS